jgi:modulator of FtsH protease
MPIAAAEISEWSELFVAAAGATAALAGLVFVAISINIERILGLEGVAELGLVTLLLLVGVLVVSMLGLIPGQSERTFGIELLVQSVIWSIAIFCFVGKSMAGVGDGEGRIASRLILPIFGTLPYLVGAVLLVVGTDSAMYWIFAGMLGAIIAAVLNAWVLLVEILR